MSASLIPLLLRRFTLRHWWAAPKQSAVLVLILALGVAVFVSIRLANRAAVASFTRFTDTLTGQSDWIVQARAGTLPESVLPEIREALDAAPVHIIPVVEATASRPATPEETVWAAELHLARRRSARRGESRAAAGPGVLRSKCGEPRRIAGQRLG
jgi:putative ABC transport system permease protein